MTATTSHPIQCTCGSLKGKLTLSQHINRCECYCKDCQAFAHFLKRDSDVLNVLNSQGGTDIIQTLPKYVHFTKGTEHLACMRLTDKGMLRWYTTCCNTPIGNTMANFKLSFVGLIHTCLESETSPKSALEAAFGPVRMVCSAESAKLQSSPPMTLKSSGLAKGMVRVAMMMLRARLDGSYKETPFFNASSGQPIVNPTILSKAELASVKERLL